MQTPSEIHYRIKKCFCNQCFQMSTRPEWFIHQKEATEDRHKRDYTTDLYDEWIANQNNENMMERDGNSRKLIFYYIILSYIISTKREIYSQCS